MATLRYTMDTQESTIVNWHRQIDPHIRLFCSGISLGLFLRPIYTIIEVLIRFNSDFPYSYEQINFSDIRK